MDAPCSVAGIVLEEGRLFVARRGPGGGLGGKWEFPGGKVEAGESCEDALAREFLEEFGVPVMVGQLLAGASFTHKGKARSLRAYMVRLESRRFTLSEHTEWRWVFPVEIPALDFAGSDLKLLPELEKYFLENSFKI
jgi:8-oxo-dGTP diphosphatase